MSLAAGGPLPADALILALETSCDDTCAALVDGGGVIRANVISSQGVHDRFGGVVPEIASREHLRVINAAIDDALARAGATLDDVDLVAVTQGPGLVGALLVGLATAKALAAARGLPLAPVDHLQGHVAANYLAPEPLEPPFCCLIASGGHTLLGTVASRDDFTVLGRTLDDAAGEAFDKGARLLGLGYPGGAALERLAAEGDPDAFAFPGRGPAVELGRLRARAGLLLRRAEDGAPVHGSRPRGGRDASAGAAISPPRTRRRSPRPWPRARSARSSRRACRVSRSAAGSPRTARCASACGRSASRSTSPRASCAPTTRR